MQRIDLEKYFARIGYQGERQGTYDVLAAIHLAHATQIPFENLDILLGRPIHIDLASIEAKLLDQRRGGYCFEQNMLLADVLEQLGFEVTRLAASVRLMTERPLPRTHMLLKVDLDGTSYLADCGFGGCGPLQPIEMVADREAPQFAWRYRLERQGDNWILQGRIAGTWHSYYQFSLDPQRPVDFEPANWYVSTYPLSRFTLSVIAQRSLPDVRYLVRNGELVIMRGDDVEIRPVTSHRELLAILAEHFELHFPPETVFRSPINPDLDILAPPPAE